MIQLLTSYDFSKDNIDYQLNSQGYRCPEFDSIDWANSVVVFGCSQTFGSHLRNIEHTVAHQLSLTLNCPVVNLGMGATSYTYQWINSTILKSNGIVPKAAVYLWPEHSRQTIFCGVSTIANHRAVGWWSLQPDSDLTDIGLALVADKHHGTVMSHYQSESVQTLWEIPVVQYSWAPPAPNKHIKTMNFPIDWAEDGLHPGLETNKLRANIIASDLRSIF
jgi:hypothetical protein